MNDARLIFERSVAGRSIVDFPACDLMDAYAPEAEETRGELRLPQVAEVDLVRHYCGLSRKAEGVDTLFYPLGSCTMKYNPKLNEKAAALPGFNRIHPLQEEDTVQGCLAVMSELQDALAEITGMDAVTLQPAAGAHGEWTGLQLIRAYHLSRGDVARKRMIVPDSAHGTNPASAAMQGFQVVSIPSTEDGMVDLEALKAVMDDTVAGFMLTNPNTLGIFDKNIPEITKIVHQAGGLMYYDGANLNAIMGVTRPGDMGFDVVHWNLHKTLGTPHGGGGPGSGPVGCKAFLAPFLPVPVVEKTGEGYTFRTDLPQSIGSVKAFYGNFLVMVKAWCYVLSLGGKGLKEASQNAVLNANYMRAGLEKYSDFKYSAPCMHEFILSLETLHKEKGVSAMDVAKGMIDRGIHPPTMYFPLIVHEPLMFEPTETESRETLDAAIRLTEELIRLAETDPEALHQAPVSTPVGRMDEVGAARNPRLTYSWDD